MSVRNALSAAPLQVCLLICLAHGTVRAAETRHDDDAWHFSLTPYVWLPTINSNLQFTTRARPIGGGGLEQRLVTISSEIGPNDYLSDLNMALMIAANAQKGRWSIGADLIYLSLSGERSTVGGVQRQGELIPIELESNLGTETDLKTGALTLLAGYEVLTTERATGSILFGSRYLDVDADLDWNLQVDVEGTDFVLDRRGRASRGGDLWDALVGFKGRLWLGEDRRWYVPYYVDAGAGSSKFTWQAMTGLGYSFRHSDLLFVYRHLEYDNDDSDDLVEDLSLSGPAIGWSFRF